MSRLKPFWLSSAPLFSLLILWGAPVFGGSEKDLLLSPADRIPAKTEFEAVVKMLGTVALVEADFSERKDMRVLAQPILSSGKIVFSPSDGLYRKMDTPFDMDMIITRKEFIQRNANGESTRMNVGKIPPAKAFIDLFLSILSGDAHRWEKHFDVFFLGTPDHWQIGFLTKPKSPVARGLRQVFISGDGPRFDVVTTVEKNGDRTTTRYSGHRIYLIGDPALTDHIPFPEIPSNQ